MKLAPAFLVAFLALSTGVSDASKDFQGKSPRYPSGPGPQGGPPGAPPPGGPSSTQSNGNLQHRQGRGLGDFLGPFRNFFGSRSRGNGKQYGAKPSETQNKPNTAAVPYEGFSPNFPAFNDGFGGDFGPPPNSHPPGKNGGGPGGKPGRPFPRQPNYQPPPPNHNNQRPNQHPGGPQGFRGQPGPQEEAQLTHHTFAKPLTQHHHYHAFMPQNDGQYNDDSSQNYYDGQPQNYIPQRQPFDGPPVQGAYEPNRPFDGPSNRPFDGPSGGRPFDGPGGNRPFDGPSGGRPFDGPSGGRPFDGPGGNRPFDGPSNRPFEGASSPRPFGGPQSFDSPSRPPPNFDNPQSAQQFNRPVSRPGPGGAPGGDFNGNSFENDGFGNFGGFGGPTEFPSSSTPGPRDQGFFGASDYPEQFEEQTRNTREPDIITADFLGQNSGGQSPGDFSQGFEGGFGGGNNANNFPSPQGSSSFAFPETQPTQTPGPIFKSHPLRPAAGGRGGPPFSSTFGNHGESRPQPYLYRPVSSSIRVPGAVDEDAVYGKPMMMSATQKKNHQQGGQKKFRTPSASASKHRPQYKAPPPPTPAPFRRPEDVVTLESPRDPTFRPPFQRGVIEEPDAAASGHGHDHHHHHDHHLESANGDRILYHVAGHQGPYSYRFGYDTGKGYNRQFRFEEKDGKGYVTGKYGFYDKHGKLNLVNYHAHPEHGYHAEREHGNVHQSHHINH